MHPVVALLGFPLIKAAVAAAAECAGVGRVVYELIKAEYVNGANVTRLQSSFVEAAFWEELPHKQKSSIIQVGHRYDIPTACCHQKRVERKRQTESKVFKDLFLPAGIFLENSFLWLPSLGATKSRHSLGLFSPLLLVAAPQQHMWQQRVVQPLAPPMQTCVVTRRPSEQG